MIHALLVGLVLFFLYLDLGFLHSNQTQPSNKTTTIEVAYWFLLSIMFSGIIYWGFWSNIVENPNNLSPIQAVIKYLTGYLIELSLSVDNLFVIALIFSSMNIPLKYQRRVLFWGILGAMFFRAALIFPGTYLIQKINWMSYLFGLFLFYTAFKVLKDKDQNTGTETPPMPLVANIISRFLPISNSFDGEKFFIIENGIKKATPLLLALIVIEFTDILFALDSIPAILAITTDPLLVFSSNIFAILGLRAMYFFLVSILERFYYIKYSVFVILVFVAIKLILMHHIHLPEWISLLFIIISLSIGIIYSKKHPYRKPIS